MQALLFHPKTHEMFITSKGLTDPYFRDGWRCASHDKVVPTHIIDEMEYRGYNLVDEPENNSLPQVHHEIKRHTTLFDTATTFERVIY